MKVMLADEAHDKWETLDVNEVKREGQSLAIVTGPLTILIEPLNEFAEKVVDLIGKDDD